MKSLPRTPSPPHGTTGRTDLGRRLAAHREALGLSREELGRHCGADGKYIAYLEEHAASPATGTLVRIAHALGVTVDDLTGANAHRSRGRATAHRDTTLLTLAVAECRRLLGTHGVGRIAVFGAEGPSLVPVNYTVAGHHIAFRTRAGSAVARAAGTDAAFEIDHIDDVTAGGWSVQAVGRLEAVTDAEEIRHLSATARSRPWAGADRTHWMRLVPSSLTGRRVVHG
ncbi:pyridoxamine 5'-phosphate oxidase family protein [Streptomyces sp. NPDC089919]|uniref:helix-turn-helix domain-containing protein n=1 Tax=Streptomyces sp. NPDC089919 TaxID=3155188 RepID=UPI003412143A